MELDLEHVAVDVRQRLQEARAALLALCRTMRVRLLVLFGSLAHDDPHGSSDVDLAVDLGPAASPEQELAFLGMVVSTIGTDRVDVVNLRSATPLALREVALHGVPIYEAAPGAFAELQVAALGRYMDTARFRRLRSRLLTSRHGPA